MFRDFFHIHSAGGIVFSYIKGVMHVALVAQPVAVRDKERRKGSSSFRWTFPKGVVGEEESDQGAAIRKVGQELGIQAEIVTQVDEVCYVMGTTFKTVQHYWMEQTGGTLNTGEYHAAWFPIPRADDLLRYPEERYVLRLASNMVKIDPR